MKKVLNKLLLVLLLMCSAPLVSQIDTVFWFAAPWITAGHNGKSPLCLRISSYNQATTVRVRQPAGTYDTTFTVPANTLFSKFLNHLVSSLENIPANTVHNRGIKITSDFPITVVWDFITPVPFNPETYSLKGQNGLGKEFVCPFQTKGINGGYSPQPKSQITIAATDNNTIVWITPRCNVIGHLANITYSVLLNYGQSYNIENITHLTNVAGQNLSGTIVVSNKDISVSVSDDSVGGVGGCFDLMGDQIVPVDIVGKEYIVNKGGMLANQFEGAYIVATENFTQININDGTVPTFTLLNKGDTYFYKTTQALTNVVADKNVYLLHASGFGCELGEALLPPINCAGSNQVSFSRNTSTTQSFFLNILCRTGSEGNFTLNGSTTLVPASAFTVVPGTGGVWRGAQIQYSTSAIPLGSANLISNNNAVDSIFALGIINGAPSEGCLYHYMSSFLRKVFTKAGPDLNLCTATTTIALTGTVEGGAVAGIWTTNGTGTFGGITNLNTTYTFSPNDLNQSQIRFVLSSTGNCVPIRDTFIVNLFKSPIIDAGNGATLCKNNISPVTISGTLQFALGSAWTSTGSGSFGNLGFLNTTYLPSPADLVAGVVKLTLTSVGSLNGCPNTKDTLFINFTDPAVVGIGSDLSVCANNPTVAISGSVTVGSTSGFWTGTGSGLFSPSTSSLNTVYQLSASDISQGTVIIKLTSQNNGNCKLVYDSLILTVTQPPNINAGINDTICSSNIFYPINGTVSGGATSGTWSTLGNGTFGNINNLNTIYTLGQADTLAGQVQILLTSTGTNCLPKTDTLLVTIAKSPIVLSGIDQLACNNQQLPLNGSVLGLTTSGVWSTLGTGVFTPNDSLLITNYQPSAIDLSNGSVLLVLTSTYNKGCVAVTDTIKLTFIPAPIANFIGNNECAGKQIQFTDNSTNIGGPITNWSWNFGDLGVSILKDPTHNYANPGTYTVTHVTINSSGCKDTVVKTIDIYFLPQAQFYQNTPCVGNITQFVDSTKTLSGSITAWNWNFGDNGTSILQNPAHPFNMAQNYTVSLIVTSSFGCKDTLSKTVTVIPGPKGDFSVNPNPVEALETAQFTDLTTGPSALVNWFWSFGDANITNVQNPEHNYNMQGDYVITLVVKDINGCIDTVRKDISVILLPDIPTAFTPNGDGQNDLFLVRGGPFKTINMRIYNNWGQFIFESNDQLEGWNGTYNGTEQPIGVFVWVVEVEMLNGKKIKKTGDVTLLR